MFSMFKQKNNDVSIEYDIIMSQARDIKLYTEYGVSDTPQGRFQMIALHAAPFFIRYEKAEQRKKSQALFDIIFNDIELSFREIGVGDLAVPKKMKRYMQDFNGLIQGHAAANADHVDLTRRNVFSDDAKLTPDFKNYIKGLFDEG